MPVITSKVAFRIVITLGLSLMASLALFSSRHSAASISTRVGKQTHVLNAVGEANPYIKLQESREIQANYSVAGAPSISSAMMATNMKPLALASGDVNEDGYPDLICGYTGPEGGMLTLHRANPQAFAPTDPEVIKGIARSEFPDPFLEEATVIELSEAPDFVGTGDFNRDGKIDLVVAARGGTTLYLLEGDGTGRFANPLSIPLPGAVSAMVTGGFNNRDGLVDVILGSESPSGPLLVVYDGIKSILETDGIEYSLPAKAASLALGRLDDDQYEDLAILANGQVLILHGHDNSNADNAGASKKAGKLETVETPFTVKAFALGEFIWDRESRVEMAMMVDDGSVHIVARGELDTRPRTPEEMLEKRREMARIRDNAEKRRGKSGPALVTEATSTVEAVNWHVAEDIPALADGSVSAAAAGSGDSSGTPLLFSTRISTLPSDDLLIVNPANRQLQLRYKETPKEGDDQLATKSAERSSLSVDLDSDVTAVLPMRVNVDGRPGFVTLSKGKGGPSVFLPLAGSTFTVTTATDSAAAGSGSLRRAIIDANANPGADMIVFNAGINPTLTIPSGGGHEDAAATGDLDITDSVTITGNSPTTISTSYTNTCGDCKVFGVNQVGSANGLAVSFTGVTIQNGFNDGTNFSGTFFETGGGIDFFLTGSGNVASMTNCTITNNKTQNGARSHGGGVNVDGANTASPGGPSGGSITFTSCTITNNSSTADGGGGIFLAADKHDATLTNCVITGNSCTGGTGGGVQVTHSFGGTVTINGASGSVSNNTASTSGGGIMVTFNQVTNISNITVSNNTATGAGGSSLGGGVLIDTLGAAGVTGSTTLTNVTISTNHANNGANAIGGGVRYGGFYAATMTGCTVSGNTSKNGAGVGNGGSTQTPTPTFAISGGSITGNAATGDGGAFVSIGTGSPTASVTTFSNVVIGGTGVGQPNTAVNGGGLADTQTGSVTVTGNSISGNSATTSGGGVYITGGALTLDGVTVDSNTATNGDGLHQSAGLFTGANTINFNSGDSVNIVGGTFNSTPGTLNLTGNFSNSGGTFNHNGGAVIFNGTTAQSLGGTTSSAFNILTVNKTGTLTLGNNMSVANVAGGGNLTVTAGVFDLSTFTINRAAPGGALTVSNGTTLKIGGTNTLPSNFNTHSIGATSTIEYSGTNQNVATLNSAQKYGNLLTSGSGTKTLAGNISVATLLSIGASTTLDASVSNFTINDAGTWTNSGTFTPRSGTVTFDGSSGTQTLTGNTTFFNLTLNNSGATTAFGTTSTTIGNNLVTTAGTMDGGASTITFTGGAGAISGATAKNFNNLVINSGAVISNTTGGDTNIANDYTNNGTFTQAAALTTTFNTGADGNHSLSGNGATTFGNVAINGSNTVDAASHSFNVVGASFTAPGTFTGNTSTVTFNGGVAQTILGDGAKNFSGLTINNANGVTVNDTTPAIDATVSAALTLTTNLTIAAGAVVQQSGTSTGAGDAIGTIRRTDLGVTARAFGNLNNTIAVDTGTAPTQMDMTLALIAPPDFTTAVTRTYTLTPTGGSGISATLKLHYLNAQLNGNTEAKLGLWKKVAGVWAAQGRTGAVDTVNKSVTLTGVSSFSDWTLADLPDVSVAVAPTSVLEDSGTAMVYTFTRTGSTTSALTVNFSVTGTATPPGGGTPDYSQTGADTFTTSSGTVTIAAGNASAVVNVTPLSDTTLEPDETAILTVTSGAYNIGVPSAATGTITNDDTEVSVAVSPASTPEDGAGNLVFTFTRQGVTTGALTANFTIGGTATPPGGATPDYTQTGAATFVAPNGTVTFAAGSSTATVTIDPTADTTVEPDETVILTVAAGTGYTIGAANTATGTIANDDADVSVTVSPTSSLEDTGPNMVYTFTRTGFTGAALTINFSVGGTAVFIAGPGSDYTQTGAATFTPTTGTVTFTGTNTTATVTIDPTADVTGEPDETVILTVTSGTGYNPVAPTSATGTILNDDTAVSVAVSPTSALEDGATNMVYTFTRTGDTSTALTVNFSVGGTATPPGGVTPDYSQTGAATFTTTTGTVSIPIGSATATVTIDPTTDTTVEPDETVVLTVTAGSGYNPGPPTAATGTITNDDTDVSVAVSPSSVAEDGAPNLVYTFTRTGVTTGALTVNFSVGGTATPPGGTTPDYSQTGAATFTTTTGTVNFTGSNTTATVTLDPTGDNTVEPDETAILTVTAGTGYNVAAANFSATGTITNDDATVSVAVSPASVVEDSAGVFTYTFTRTGFTGGPLTVNFDTAGSTASASGVGADYTVSGTGVTFVPATGLGTVTFSGSNTTTTMTVDPTTDAVGEQNETVIVNIAAGTNYTATAPVSATGTIQDDDTSVGVTVSPASVLENSGTAMVYTFTRTGDTTSALTVNFSATGTASPTSDYAVTGTGVTFTPGTGLGTIAIGSGVTMVTANVTPNPDSTVEPDETVIITVTAGTGYIPNSGTPSATGTITNDDTDVTVAVSPASTAEDGAGNLVYTFTRAGVTTASLTVNFSVGGTALFGSDYGQTGAATFTTTSGTATFGVGNSTVAVTVDPTADMTVEPDETVILMVTAGAGYNIGAPDTASGTITNDDTDVTLTVSGSPTSETGPDLVYTFTRSGVTTGALTVNFSVGGTATFTSDYTQTGAATFGASSGTVTITAGNTTATVMLTPVNDALVEGSETAVLALTAGGYGIGTPNTATGTITDNDTATIAFAAASSNAPEQTTPHNVGVTLAISANGAGTPMLGRAVMVNVQDLGTGSATGGGTDYTFSSPQTVTFNSGDIAQTKNVSIAIVNDLLSEGNETINLALNTLVDGTSGQVSLTSPLSDTVTIVDNDIDLKVTKAESVDPVAAGSGPGNLTYTITLKNNGLTNATGIVLSEALTIPSGVTVDSVTGSAGTSVTPIDTTHYTWNVGSRGVSSTATLTAVLTVGAAAMSGTNSICDTATVTASNEVRVNTGDDTATECTSVVAQADLEITSKTDTPDPACVDGTITYTIGLRNNGPGPGLNTTMTDPVPANTTFVSASVITGSGWSTSAPVVGGTGNVVFSKASVGINETAVFQVVVKINAGTLHGTTISNTATAGATLIDPTPGNNSKTATTTVDPIATVITCPANITVSTDPNQCSAVVNYAAPTVTDNCPCGTGGKIKKNVTAQTFCVPVCSPASGSTFAKGTTTVTCTASDAAGNQSTCSFTITVDDTQPPSITCPANITVKTPKPGDPCVIVNYTTPAGSDNCPGVGVVCNPPSGSCFPLGSTTVTCTATDTSGNTATCTFKIKVFDLCVQDDSDPTTVVLINSVTGEYRFCCQGVTYTGVGTMTIRGSLYQLDHNPGDRRVLVKDDESTHKGSGAIQAPPGTTRCTITDRNTQDNSCVCQ